jgi:mersacidin/lichenicidin family type 2 lantibiotic
LLDECLRRKIIGFSNAVLDDGVFHLGMEIHMLTGLARKLDFESQEEDLSPEDIVRAWEDRRFRSRLTARQLQKLPAHPTGATRLIKISTEAMEISGNNCSTDNCSTNNCSTQNCSTDNCSTNNCSTENCSTNNCSTQNCSTNNCSTSNCSANCCGSL